MILVFESNRPAVSNNIVTRGYVVPVDVQVVLLDRGWDW